MGFVYKNLSFLIARYHLSLETRSLLIWIEIEMKSSFLLSSDFSNHNMDAKTQTNSLDEVFIFDSKPAKIEQEASYFENADEYIGI